MLLLLTPRYLALRNRLTRLAPGDGLKTAVLGMLGLGFWVLMFGISFKVLSSFRTIEGLGDLLALRLMSMIAQWPTLSFILDRCRTMSYN